uniref:Short chain dehydrogenase n=1 Tax=Psilocybe cubensis TaxID=181762 RepID=A0A8H7XLS4_PSICU
MATLQNKKVVVVGGSSGIGFAVALGALQSLASLVIIASSNKARVEDAVARLKAHNLPGEIRGEVLDAKDSDAVKAFAVALGAVDHIVWTSGDVPKAELGGPSGPFSIADSVDKGQGLFTIRFWGPFIVAKHAKFNPGGSLTLTSGRSNVLRPFPGGALGSSVATALEGLTRGLAVDIAPVRVNLICPGLINTELIEKMFGEHKDHITKTYVEKILMKRGGDPSECAEAYLFVMKCGYITGQKIDVEGGYLLI